MDYILFASAVLFNKVFFVNAPIISSINNENQITILKGGSKPLVTGIQLHAVDCPKSSPKKNYYNWSNVLVKAK